MTSPSGNLPHIRSCATKQRLLCSQTQLLFLAVEFLVNIPQLAIGDMSIDLGRRDRRVAEHLLHGPQVGSVEQQVGREAVS